MKLAVLAAAIWCASALAFLFQRARAFGKRKLFAPAAGDPMAGVRYAFTKGLSPTAKESVREHPATWLLGVGYHAGIFAAFTHLAGVLLGLSMAGFMRHGLQVFLGLGALSGGALLAKRAALPHLRGLSTPDDYFANGLASALCLLALWHSLHAQMEPWFLGEAILLLLYAPLGKLRHCLFFFSTRFHFGAFFGRRGVFPTSPRKA